MDQEHLKRIGKGYLVVTGDEVDLGNVKQYDPTTGWMLVGNTALGKNDLLLPVTLVSRVDRRFGEVHLAVSAAHVQRMKHLEPVDVVFATSKTIPAGG